MRADPGRVGLIVMLLFCGLKTMTVAVAQDMPLTQVLLDDEPWEQLGAGYQLTDGPAADQQGRIYFSDVPSSRIYLIDLDGEIHEFARDTGQTNGLMFGPDGRLYGCRSGDRQLVSYDPRNGSHEVIVEGVDSSDLVIDPRGGIYFTDPLKQRVWYINPQRDRRIAADNLRPNGVIMWNDGGTIVVTERDEPFLWTFRIESDGTLSHRAPYYGPLQILPGRKRPGSDGMTMDQDGRLYVATFAGIQMFDPTGRLGGTIAHPPGVIASNVTFGGPGKRYLYATCGNRVYRRLTRVQGVLRQQLKQR